MKIHQVVLLFVALPIVQYFAGMSLAIQPWVRFEPYVIFWLVIPFTWAAELSLIVGLAFGLVLDVFFPPYGAHAFSGLWVWALRGFWARIVRPFQSPDEVPHPETFSLGEWTLYAFPLCLVYLLSYSLLQAVSWKAILWTPLSASYSFLGILVIFAIFIRRSDAK